MRGWPVVTSIALMAWPLARPVQRRGARPVVPLARPSVLGNAAPVEKRRPHYPAPPGRRGARCRAGGGEGGGGGWSGSSASDGRNSENVMRLPRRRFLHLAAGVAALPAISDIARAQTYPERPVRLIAPGLPGDVADLFARLYGEWLAQRLD